MSVSEELDVTTDVGRGPKLGTDAPVPRRSVAPLLIRLHFYAGVRVAPFLVVAAVTGLTFVFTPQIDNLVYSHKFFVDEGTQRTPLAERVNAAGASHPEGAAGSVILNDGSDRPRASCSMWTLYPRSAPARPPTGNRAEISRLRATPTTGA